MLPTRFIAFAALVAVAAAQSLVVNNLCSIPVFLFTQTGSGQGSISNDITLAAGQTGFNMGISSNWDGAINVGTGCNSDGSSCTTGGPQWDGVTPFSRAEFNFFTVPGEVTYDISMIYGFNVGMEITSADTSCAQFACDLGSSTSCPVPGPGSNTCYSPCCSSAAACSGGALPASGGGCVDNAGPGPNSPYYYDNCPNAYAFPDNDGSGGYTPADFVDYTCDNTAITLTLCPGFSSDLSD
ncbi:hypothetical protein HMN09_01057800 [Mycena chlorophos]|uniref:Osmotin thaumatin-like protein n=1 Tax=Mycena chlorophos TaxID=658473 RepID=A0A8H6SBK0_MYCCL|nr:hypothetical protein HMN09_01057800 [Mycena chlorophos]